MLDINIEKYKTLLDYPIENMPTGLTPDEFAKWIIKANIPMKRDLVLIRGLPGSGKSTFAKSLLHSDAVHYEADMWHMRDGVYDWKPERQHYCHTMCQNYTGRSMMIGTPLVIVSNTFTTNKEMKPYKQLALEHGYRLTTIIVENNHGNKSIHDVPDETMEKMRSRFQYNI